MAAWFVVMEYKLHSARPRSVVSPFRTSNSSGIAMAGKGRCNLRHGHEVTRGHRRRLCPRGQDERRPGPQTRCRGRPRGRPSRSPFMVPAYGRLCWTGSALANHRAMAQRGLRLVGGEVPPVRDPGQHSPGCRAPTPATRRSGSWRRAQMPVVPNAAAFTASAYDQADRNFVRSHRIFGFIRTTSVESFTYFRGCLHSE